MQCRRAKNSNLQIVERKTWTSGCRRIPIVFSNTPNLLVLSPILNKSDNRIIEWIFIHQQNWMEINLDNNKLGTIMNESQVLKKKNKSVSVQLEGYHSRPRSELNGHPY